MQFPMLDRLVPDGLGIDGSLLVTVPASPPFVTSKSGNSGVDNEDSKLADLEFGVRLPFDLSGANRTPAELRGLERQKQMLVVR